MSPATGAPIAMDGMFGDHRSNVLWDIFGVAPTRLFALIEGTATTGTAFEPMRPLLIDAFGCRPPTAGPASTKQRRPLPHPGDRSGGIKGTGK